ncbi:MAG: hypothetical protein JNJ98_02995 [Gemmatimonadetes bacterium]|nr:hypothetical protein [Gemmatimonadota bacterium]
MRRTLFTGLLALAPLGVSAQSGLVSSTATVLLSATKVSQLSVTVTAGGTQTLASMTDGTVNNFPTPVSITTAWNLSPSTSAVVLVGYFTAPAAALSNGSNNLPSSRVLGRLGTTGGFSPFTGGTVSGGTSTIGVAGGTLQLFSQGIFGFNRNASRTDALYLQLNLTGITTVPGTYTGTLNLRAITQ